ncbi:MAG TPA: hypothetical protein VJT85_10720, partial [Gemmatimonadaceae bacterium]|nr:hypothetical protein [Gemmatimonadaceae bacterium]
QQTDAEIAEITRQVRGGPSKAVAHRPAECRPRAAVIPSEARSAKSRDLHFEQLQISRIKRIKGSESLIGSTTLTP